MLATFRQVLQRRPISVSPAAVRIGPFQPRAYHDFPMSLDITQAEALLASPAPTEPIGLSDGQLWVMAAACGDGSREYLL